MRFFFVILTGLMAISLLMGGQGGKPFPPGVRQAETLPNPTTALPPQVHPRRRAADPAQLQREAEELARLAQAIPADIGAVIGGRMPKELNERLKRIEKLSKQLRREVSP